MGRRSFSVALMTSCLSGSALPWSGSGSGSRSGPPHPASVESASARVASRWVVSTSSLRSSTLIRSCRVSTVSSSRTGTAAWSRMAPVSTPESMRKIVAPVTFTPYASASRGPCMPGKDGSSAGWVLIIRPPNRSRNAGPTSFMNPALITRSGSYPATRSVRPKSQAARSSSRRVRVDEGRHVEGGRAFAARRSRRGRRRRPPPVRRTPGSALASSKACSRVPEPEMSTTSRAGWLVAEGTGVTLPSEPGLSGGRPRRSPRPDRRGSPSPRPPRHLRSPRPRLPDP